MPPADEDDTIDNIVLEDRGLDAIPADGSEERTKFDNNVVVQYKRTMAYLRERNSESYIFKSCLSNKLATSKA